MLSLFVVALCCSGTGALQAQTDLWELFNTENSPLPDNAVLAICEDELGRIWVGTQSGLAVLDGESWTMYTTGNSELPDNDVRALAAEPGAGAVWIGTFLGGLARFDGAEWELWNSANSPLPDNFVRELYAESAERIWIGTTAGLLLKEGEDWTIWNTSNSDLPGNNIPAIHLDPDGTPWIGTINSGIARYNGKGWENWTIANSALVDNTILDIARDEEANLWLATPAGGLIIMTAAASFLTFNTLNSAIPDNEIARIAVDDQDRGVLGMTSAGVVRFDGDEWEHWNSANSNLPDDRIRSMMLSSEQTLWVGMLEGGLARFVGEDSVVGLPVAGSGLREFVLFPNVLRAGERIHWSYRSGAHAQGLASLVGISDMNGRYVLRENCADGNALRIPQSLPAGWYMLEFRQGDALERRRFLLY